MELLVPSVTPWVQYGSQSVKSTDDVRNLQTCLNINRLYINIVEVQ